jgi:hypothetical protein
MPRKLITKSRYMYGLQCLKLLWLAVHDPRSLSPPDGTTQRIFDQGHQVGEVARRLFADGIEIPSADFKNNLKVSRELLSRRKPLYEAGFISQDLYCRVDILLPGGEDGWDILEVKSATSPKDENFHDLSFQKLCCQRAGLEVRRCLLAYINNQYVRRGEINPTELFKIEDVSEAVSEAGAGLEERLERIEAVLATKTCPEEIVGIRCQNPYACPVESCWKELPNNNILTLLRGGSRCFDFLNRGIFFIRDLPGGEKLTPAQQIQKWCDVNNQPYVDKPAIRDFLATINDPVSFLDFETFSPAIPLFDGTRPYQKIPFQYSLHALKGRQISHAAFLAEGAGDPRPELLRRLKQDLAGAGSILVYNQSFEEGVLEELGRDFPAEGAWIDQAVSRLRDLYQPFRDLDYYHPSQAGSLSLKKVMPALAGLSYAGLAIREGDQASSAYLQMASTDICAVEKSRIRADLLKYCALDTEGMMELLEKLRKLAAPD